MDRSTRIASVVVGVGLLAFACKKNDYPHQTWDSDTGTEADTDTLCENLAPEPSSMIMGGLLLDSVADIEYNSSISADEATAQIFTAEGYPKEAGKDFSVVYDFGEYEGIPEYATGDTDNPYDRTDRHMVLLTYDDGQLGGHVFAECDLENERVVIGGWSAWEELHVGQFADLGDDYFYRMNTVFQDEGDPEPCASATLEHPLGTVITTYEKACPGVVTEYVKELDSGNKTEWYKIDLASTNMDGFGTIGIVVGFYYELVELENRTTMDDGETNIKVFVEPKAGPDGNGPKVLKQIKLWGLAEPCTDYTGSF